MQDRFKFKAVLKTSEFVILVKPYYILEDSYFIDINQAETEFKNKYPEECFWDFIDEIKKQDYVQEISSDSDLIITKDFTNLIQCTGLKDKNGKLIFEGDIVKSDFEFVTIALNPLSFNRGTVIYSDYTSGFMVASDISDFSPYKNARFGKTEALNCKVIGNIYENPELIGGAE